MKCDVISLDNKMVNQVELSDAIFAVPVRADILSRMVNYQLAKRQAGTHKTKSVGEVRGTTKKPFKQKGTGNARQGSLRSHQMVGGGCAFGPVPRSHAISLPKKLRKLALKTAISSKVSAGKLLILDDMKFSSSKTKELMTKFSELGLLQSSLLIGGSVLDENFSMASSNIPNVDVLPCVGINVYDILRRDYLVLSLEALKYLEEKLV
jgi:large subunit ribosomal protein L4